MRCSWLIPVRNGGQWLHEAVASAVAECGPEDEVVVVDDGSVDGCTDGLVSGGAVRVLHQEAAGIVAALETGRAACRGRYIARLDADDRALAGRVSAQVAVLENRPEVAAVGGRARIFCDHGEVPEGMRLYVERLNGLVTNPHRELLVESPLFHPGTMLRSSAVDGVGGYRDGDFPEDYDLWLRLVRAGHELGGVERDVVGIRDHGARLTRSDARYRRAAFDRCRQDHLAATCLHHPRRVALWAGKQGGRPWLPWLRERGHDVVAVIDLAPGPDRGGTPVVAPEALHALEWDVLLVAVGRRGARELIRERLRSEHPQRLEGQDWFAVL